MKLVLSPPPMRELHVEISPVATPPEDPDALARAQLGHGRVERRLVTAAAGWPVLLYQVADPDGKTYLAIYRFLEYAAMVGARCPAAQLAHEPAILAFLLSGTIDWQGQPLLTLAQIFDGVDGA